MMRGMPGTNLTRDEAATRGALLTVDSYDICLDLTVSDKVFDSTTVIRFSCSDPGAATFADLHGATVHEITLNGTALDPFEVYRDQRVQLDGLAADNELTVRCELPYSTHRRGAAPLRRPCRRAGLPLHPVRGARRPPRLHHLRAAGPQGRLHLPRHRARRTGRWCPTPPHRSPRAAATAPPCGTSPPRSGCRPTSPRWWPASTTPSTTTYAGAHGTIALGHFCRQSIKEHLDHEQLIVLTKQGFAFFEEAFDYPYPFGKYDQLLRAGVQHGRDGERRLRDLPRRVPPPIAPDRTPSTRQRANTVLHEMAHMWFGDLVTMRWWDDLWLNESFAEWASAPRARSRPPSSPRPGPASPTPARTGPTARTSCPPPTRSPRTTTTCRPSRSTSTASPTPRAPRPSSSWSPGSASRTFLAGLRDYFKTHAFAQLRVLRPARPRSRRPPAASCESGPRSGCRPRASTRWRPTSRSTTNGTLHVVLGRRRPPRAEFPTLRRHRIGIGLYDLTDAGWSAARASRSTSRAPRPTIDELVGAQQPDLLLLNDGDLTYAKIRLDERSLATAVAQHRPGRRLAGPSPAAGAPRGT